MGVRVLVLADTHVGVDHALHPRVERRRRGEDFLTSFERALVPALTGAADVVVHAGDVFDHPRVPPALVDRGLGHLRRVAAAGVPVIVVPGNHERARVDVPLLLRHPNLHVLTQPGTIELGCAGVRIAFGGFPYQRDGIRARFRDVLAATALAHSRADVRVLCMHHCVEGATCGPGEFTFRDARDVVRAKDLPAGVAAILTGHIHRHQFLRNDLTGAPLPAPVLYPGSVERTSFAEKDETKGFAMVELEPDGGGRGRIAAWSFHPLPARPMVVADLLVAGASRAAVERAVAAAVHAAPVDAVLRLRLVGALSDDAAPALRAESLRALAPPTLNLSVVCADTTGRSHWK